MFLDLNIVLNNKNQSKKLTSNKKDSKKVNK